VLVINTEITANYMRVHLHAITAKGGSVSHQYRDQSGSGSLTR
jgi:hypothetical protein